MRSGSLSGRMTLAGQLTTFNALRSSSQFLVGEGRTNEWGLMPKKNPKLRPDVAETAFRVMQEATGAAPKTLPLKERTEKNADAVKRGRKGGKKGGKARAANLSPNERTAIAKKAGSARWGKSRGSE